MSCRFISQCNHTPAEYSPYAASVPHSHATIELVCEEHDYVMPYNVTINYNTRCPIGKIEDATDAAIERIKSCVAQENVK